MFLYIFCIQNSALYYEIFDDTVNEINNFVDIKTKVCFHCHSVVYSACDFTERKKFNFYTLEAYKKTKGKVKVLNSK
jgi:hypothetical protein